MEATQSRSRRRCDQCEVAIIQGLRCHETNCPDAWKDAVKTCTACGDRFRPRSNHEYRFQPYCRDCRH